MKNILLAFVFFLSALAAGGCSRSATQQVATPGPLPTPRSASQQLVTVPPASATPAPTAVIQPSPSPTAASTHTPSPLPSATATRGALDADDAAAIRQIEKAKPILVEEGFLMPFYRAGRELRSYQTVEWTYIVDVKTHLIVEILPVYETAVVEGQPLNLAELEQAARALIAKAAPGANLDGLRTNHSSQTSNYLFRWEDHRARVMDDRVTYPYIQVALSQTGQLLNYFNTLMFAE